MRITTGSSGLLTYSLASLSLADVLETPLTTGAVVATASPAPQQPYQITHVSIYKPSAPRSVVFTDCHTFDCADSAVLHYTFICQCSPFSIREDQCCYARVAVVRASLDIKGLDAPWFFPADHDFFWFPRARLLHLCTIPGDEFCTFHGHVGTTLPPQQKQELINTTGSRFSRLISTPCRLLVFREPQVGYHPSFES